MAFLFFMLIMGLLIPFTMVGFGKIFMSKAPKNINLFFGYRTTMSMKNRGTWEFAHKMIGKLWFWCGLVLLPLSILPFILVMNKDTSTIGKIGAIVVAVQLLLITGTIIPVEVALKKNV